MQSPRDDARREIARLIELQTELRAILLEGKKASERNLRLLERGAPIEEILASSRTAERRSSLSHLLTEFERSRHHTRAALMVAGLEEGLSIADLGRAFGISRQLASRLVHDWRKHEREAQPEQ